MKTISKLMLVFCAAALVAAACSSDDSNSTTTTGATPTTSSGSSSSAAEIVVEIQKGLTELGYYSGPIDGIYGPATTDGVRALQSDLGVTVDGRYGPETHAALVKALGGVESEAVKKLQTEMKNLGYYDGEIDGLYGPATTEAVKKVQADCNLTQDGIYGADTHQCLNDLGGDA